jgi:hypothetical protein
MNLEMFKAASEIGTEAAIAYTGQGRRLSQLFFSDTQAHLSIQTAFNYLRTAFARAGDPGPAAPSAKIPA